MLKRKKKKQSGLATERITKKTIEDHRKEVINEGKKFKYPLQYSKNKLVFNTIIISIVALVLSFIFFALQLYVFQNTGKLTYRMTEIIPMPVAMVDGSHVRYNDYLMRLRSEKHYLETKEDTDFSTKDGAGQEDGLKKQAIDNAIIDTYAAKLARQLDINVTSDEVNQYINKQKKVGDTEISDQTFSSVLQDYYGRSYKEHETIVRKSLLTSKVKYAIDKKTQDLSKSIVAELKDSNKSLQEVAKNYDSAQINYGESGGLVSKNNTDGGVTAIAANQPKGHVSDAIAIENGDAYYIIKTLEETDNEVSYEYIKVTLTKFDQDLEKLRKDGDVKYYIKIKDFDVEGGGE